MNGNCTHLSLYSNELAQSKTFYIDYLECKLIQFEAKEGILVIDMGDFRLVFSKPKGKSLSAREILDSVISHVGYEFPIRSNVDILFANLKGSEFAHLIQTSEEKLQKSAASGPYRFYVTDPNGYLIEIHSWEDCGAE